MKKNFAIIEGDLRHTLKEVKEENKFANEELGRYDDDLMAARKEIKEYREMLESVLKYLPGGIDNKVQGLLDKYPPVV